MNSEQKRAQMAQDYPFDHSGQQIGGAVMDKDERISKLERKLDALRGLVTGFMVGILERVNGLETEINGTSGPLGYQRRSPQEDPGGLSVEKGADGPRHR